MHLWDEIFSMNSVAEHVTVCSGDELEALLYLCRFFHTSEHVQQRTNACRMYDEYQAPR